MRTVWTDEAIDDLENLLAWYYQQSWPATAAAVETRILAQIDALQNRPERVRASERLPGTRELVVHRLAYVVFFRVLSDEIQVLNIVHTARKFP